MDDNQPPPVRRRRNTGRPLLPPSKHRSEKLYFRLTHDELAAIKARAQEARQPVSEFARRMVRDGKVKVTFSNHADPLLYVQVMRLGNNLNQCLVEARQRGFPPETVAAIEEASRTASRYLYALSIQGDEEDDDEHPGEWDHIEP